MMTMMRAAASRSVRSNGLRGPLSTLARSSSSRAARAAFTRRSQLWIPTEKENPADAAIPSHQLLIRGGFVRKSGHGSFSFLPLGKRVLAKLEAIIDEEMHAIQGNKVDLPLLIPAELWKTSGRWQHRGPELLAFPDRRGDMQTLAPTHEESVTSLVAAHYTNTNDSLRLYQVGRKFRDEIRPRFGLLRAREFVMKDMYSFDTSFDKALETYEDVARAYEIILRERLQLPIAKVEADSGNIGGNLSHEFHVLAAIGEDGLLSCSSSDCDYAANVEKAHGRLRDAHDHALDEGVQELVQVWKQHSWPRLVQELETRETALGIKCRVFKEAPSDDDDAEDMVKPSRLAVVFVRSDRDVNELLLKPFFNGEELQRVESSELATVFASSDDLQVFVDDSLTTTAAMEKLTSAISSTTNDPSVHHGHFRAAQEGDGCPKCHGSDATLEAKRGIEVGHVFYLGQKYSKPFDVTFATQEHGKTVQRVMEMGCFGMGVTRLIAAVVESSHDEHGIIWPTAIAPFQVLVMSIGAKRAEDNVAQTAQAIAADLAATWGDEVVLDDRWNESPGSKLTEAELLGYPFRIVVGKRFAKDGLLEVLTRSTMEKAFVAPENLAAFLQDRLVTC
ncbi:hypothetical protein P43SY_004225 [Pythium insidiosum]|uniref:proline--tRNA ligase n=1 Tax=Pythium insidiosum TaxID=114742 RepID=A0AAD5Q9A9_PYTIN|nr:hypothetical protein P43SY_004225 [Pythium insidiosum]